MHQKQPPAKTALSVSAAMAGEARAAKSRIAPSRRPVGVLVMLLLLV